MPFFSLLGVVFLTWSWFTEISWKPHKNSTTRLSWDPFVVISCSKSSQLECYCVCLHISWPYSRYYGMCKPIGIGSEMTLVRESRYPARAQNQKKVGFRKLKSTLRVVTLSESYFSMFNWFWVDIVYSHIVLTVRLLILLLGLNEFILSMLHFNWPVWTSWHYPEHYLLPQRICYREKPIHAY